MNKIKEFFKNKKANKKLVYNICLIVTVFGLLFIVSGTSYALLTGSSSSDKEQIIRAGDVTLELSEYFENTSQPISVMSDTDGLLLDETYSFKLKNIGDVPARYDVKLVNEVPSDYNDGVIDDKYVKVGVEINGEEHGPFTLEEANNILDSGIIYKNELISYEIRVWLNENYEEEILDFDGYKGFFKVQVEAEQSLQEKLDTSGANSPILDTNMIAVYYDDTSESWKKADASNTNETYQWYDYDSKMWANSVTVSNANRTTYLNASSGTEIPMEDILTMQVWVPRYKYKVWNYNADGTVGSEPQEIEIVFEEGTASTGDITCTDTISGTDGAKSESCKINNAECTDSTCNNKYYTHPAFTFGTEELEGFWIGKFELTGTIDSITTKPNISSLRNQNISSFETNIMAMNDSRNQYGFNTTTDTHMIKNMEWGAVAYLSHSKYGTCTNGTCEEVYINNSSGYYTGRSGATADADDTSTGDYQYNEKRQVDEIVEGTGTESTLSTITNDATYPWVVSSGLYTSTNKTDSTTSNLTFTFDVTSKSVLTFDWSVSSESASYDYVYYTITKDGTALSDTGTSTKIGGTTYGTSDDAMTYLNVIKILEAGSYELTFTYRKDSSSSRGTDTAYIKNVKLIEGVEVNTTTVKGGEMASTTHNIYGVYDMSGGAYEYVMGNIVDSDGTTMRAGSSGFTTYPDAKYYDKYSYGTSSGQRIRSKLGDSIKEVLNTSSRGWYSDYSNLANSYDPWFVRGGHYYNGSDAGAFYSYFNDGIAHANGSSRLVITP